MRDLPVGIVTFLFTDIEGSTRLLERLGVRYAVTADPATDHRRPRELAPFLDQPTALRAT